MRQEAGTLQAGRGYATDRIGTALDLVQQVAQAMAARIDVGVGVGQEHLLGGGVPQAMHQRAALAGVGLVHGHEAPGQRACSASSTWAVLSVEPSFTQITRAT